MTNSLKRDFKYHDVTRGISPSLEEVLKDRENRVHFQKELCNLYPNQTLIVLKVNMPGPIKNNEFVENLLLIGKTLLTCKLYDTNNIIKYEKTISTKCGISYFVVVDNCEILDIKSITIDLEDNETIGRLLDIDVFINNTSVSREQLKVGTRSCYLCSKSAKDCGRNRTHTVEQLLKHMIKVVNESR